ncbi:MAG: hypothetical protein WCI79_00040 [Candidatus Saccharibacteria bacterium]
MDTDITNRYHALRPVIFYEEPPYLVEVIKNAYGNNYNGDEKLHKKIGEASSFIMLQTGFGRIGAAAIVASGRIVVAGSTRDEEHPESRFERMIEILQACREFGKAKWASIGIEYVNACKTAELAGMKQVKNLDTIEKYLAEIAESHRYLIGQDKNGYVVIAPSSPTEKPYLQYIWENPEPAQ